MSAQLYVVTAPSGAGKTSIVREVLSRVEQLQVSVSHTTRPRRPADRDGVDYHFVAKDEFVNMIEAGEFLEHAEVFGNYYGTSRQAVEVVLGSGIDVLLEIDWQGAAQVRAALPQACSLFIVPPSLDELRKRLTGRASDAPEVIERRLREAAGDIHHYRDSDYLVVNDDFATAVEDVCTVIAAQRLRVARQAASRGALLKELLG